MKNAMFVNDASEVVETVENPPVSHHSESPSTFRVASLSNLMSLAAAAASSTNSCMNDVLSIASGYALRRSSSQIIAVQAAALSDRSVP
jgi:hypothetical protein